MKIRISVIFLVLVILLAGCSGGAKSQSKLIIGISQDFDSLDPGKSVAAGTQEVMYNIFHGLINTTPEGEIIPELCESYLVSDDLLTYTFKLREDVEFHGGQKLNSADVVYTYKRYMGLTEDQPEPLHAEIAKTIRNVTALGEYSVEFTLSEASASFIALCIAPIVPENSGPTQAENPVGAGPFQFKSYSPGIGITMTRYEKYYGQKPQFEEVEFKIFTDANAGQLALQNGEIDIMNMTSTSVAYDETKLKLVKQPQNMVQMLAFNYELEPFQDIRVRQALNHAIDKDTIISTLSAGSPRLDTNFSPVMAFYYNKDVESYYDYNPAKAVELLKDAGQENLSFTVKVPTEYKFHVDTAQMIQAMYQEVGITMNIQLIEWNSWLDEVYTNRNHEATIVGLAGKIDPGAGMLRLRSDYYRNFSNYNNPQYDALLDQAARTGDQNQRANIYKEAQMLLAQDASLVYIMDPGNNILMNKNIDGYRTYPIGYIDVRYITRAE